MEMSKSTKEDPDYRVQDTDVSISVPEELIELPIRIQITVSTNAYYCIWEKRNNYSLYQKVRYLKSA